MALDTANPLQPPDAVVYRLDNIRLRFRDPAIERIFVRESLKDALGVIRLYIAGGLLFYIVFGALDLIIGGPDLTRLWLIRFGLVCPGLLCVLGLTFLPVFARVTQSALGGAMAVSGLGIVAMTAVMRAPYNGIYYAGLIMVITWCGSLIRMRFLYTAAISVILVAAYQFVATGLNPIPREILANNDFFLVMAVGIGTFASYVQELHVRRAYIGRKIVEAKNEVAQHLLHEANKASKAKSDFLANMSHELRTPLNAIIGFSDILGQQLFGPVGDERYAGYIGDIHKSGLHLLAVINDILDLAKAEAGKLTLDEAEIDLAGCIADCIPMCRVRADSRGVTLTAHVPPQAVFAVVDRRLITQVAINLLTNAIKFTEAGGSVSIALAVHPRDGIVLAVSDTGIGIAQEDMDRILRPFEQVEKAHTRSHEGTGLGLPLAKRIVELHGGVLSVSSMLGRGTTVYVRLPNSRLVPRRLAIENAA